MDNKASAAAVRIFEAMGLETDKGKWSSDSDSESESEGLGFWGVGRRRGSNMRSRTCGSLRLKQKIGCNFERRARTRGWAVLWEGERRMVEAAG